MVAIVLEDKGLAFTTRWLSFAKGEHRSPEMLAMNPRGTIPVLRCGDEVLTESFAMLEFIDFAYPEPPLLPLDKSGRARALDRFHESANLKSAGMDLFAWLMRTSEAERSEELFANKWDAFTRELSRWEAHLGEGAWTAGQALSLSDPCVFVYLATAVQLGLELDERWPALARFYAAMRERPSVRATWPATWGERLSLLKR